MLQDLQVRLARDSDAGTIAGFNVAMAMETEGKELQADIVSGGVERLFTNRHHGFYVVAETGGKVVGSLMITYEWSDWRCGMFWWIQSVYVEPAFRRKGILTRLYEFVRGEALRDGCVCGLRLYFERSNYTAEAAYKKLQMRATNYGVFQEEFP